MKKKSLNEASLGNVSASFNAHYPNISQEANQRLEFIDELVGEHGYKEVIFGSICGVLLAGLVVLIGRFI